MSRISFEAVEKECMKYLILNTGIKQSQFAIFQKISEKFEDLIGNDPIDKNNLKYITLAVLRTLSARNDNILIEDINDVIYASHYVDMKNSTSVNDSIKANTFVEIKPTEKQKEEMPSNVSVIEFILDNKLTDHYYDIDFLGDNMLHKLINANKLDRIINHIDILINMVNVENNQKKTPIDIITDIRISNYFMAYLIKRNSINESIISKSNVNINNLYNYANNLENDINKLRNLHSFLYFIIFVVNVLLVAKII